MAWAERALAALLRLPPTPGAPNKHRDDSSEPSQPDITLNAKCALRWP